MLFFTGNGFSGHELRDNKFHAKMNAILNIFLSSITQSVFKMPLDEKIPKIVRLRSLLAIT